MAFESYEEAKEDVPVMYEETDLRRETKKVYKKQDNTYVAVYASVPIYYNTATMDEKPVSVIKSIVSFIMRLFNIPEQTSSTKQDESTSALSSRAEAMIAFNDVEFFTSGYQIIKATMVVKGSNTSVTDSVVTVHSVIDTWKADSLSWGAKPKHETDPLDFAAINGKESVELRFDITKAVNDWAIKNNTNHGILLKIADVNANENEIELSSSTSKNEASFEIEYRDVSGKPNQSDYLEHNAYRAGTAYVNEATRNLYVVRDELGLVGNKMPVTIRRYYTTKPENDKNNNHYGENWYTNYNRLLSFSNKYSDGIARYKYIDSEGNKITFIKSETVENNHEKWVEASYKGTGETGAELWIKENTNPSDLHAVFVINSDGQKEHFDSFGRLIKISENGNAIHVEYGRESLYMINKVIDGAGREYRFTYDQDLLQSIQVYSADGRQIVVNNSPIQISYNYSNKQLCKVIYSDNKSTSYSYNEKGRLTSMQNIDNFTLNVEYDDAGYIVKITESYYDFLTNQATLGSIITIEPTSVLQNKFIKNSENDQIKTFDIYGRVLTNLGDTFEKHEYEDINENGTISSIAAAYTEVDPFKTEDNLIQNGDMKQARNSSPQSWNVNLTKHDKIVTDEIYGKSVKVMNIVGDIELDKNLKQTIELSASKDDVIKVGGWAKSGSASTSEPSDFSIVVEYTEKTIEEKCVKFLTKKYEIPFDPYTDGWQHNARRFAFEGDCSSVTVYIKYGNQINESSFYGIYLQYENLQIDTDSPDEKESLDYLSSGYCICMDCTEAGCPCLCQNEKLCSCNPCLRSRTNKTVGREAIVSKTDGQNHITSKSVYSNDFNTVEKTIDENGIETLYSYDAAGNNSGVQTGNEKITYQHNAAGALMEVAAYVSGLTNGTSMTSRLEYDGDRVKSIIHNGMRYEFEYDSYGNTIAVKQDRDTFVCYSYSDALNGVLNKIVYENGDSISYEMVDGLVERISYDGGKTVAYQYEYEDSSPTKIIDNINGQIFLYNGNKTEVREQKSNQIVYSSETTEENVFNDNYLGVKSVSSEKDAYDIATGITSSNYNLSIAEEKMGFSYQKDYFERDISYEIKTDERTLATRFSYKNVTGNQTSNQIASQKHFLDNVLLESFDYHYDEKGNIKEVIQNNQVVHSYSYDEMNQLIREDNAYFGYTYIYQYDVGGNLVSKKTYQKNNLTQLLDETFFSYEANILKTVNGQAFSYDAVGNPLSITLPLLNEQAALTWFGQQLDVIKTNDLTAKYKYNNSGLRVYKEVNSAQLGEYSIQYMWDDDVLIGMQVMGLERQERLIIKFIYGESNDVLGFITVDSSNQSHKFLYVKNQLGDILHIYSPETDEFVVSYSYDAWGNVMTKTNDTAMSVLAQQINPFTYRGYQYDSDTGLYYLKSRYYSPGLMRFINADHIGYTAMMANTPIGANAYAYCLNNPVNQTDATGRFPIPKRHPFSQKNRYGANKGHTEALHVDPNWYKGSRIAYINGQSRSGFYYYQFGSFWSDHNGCGWISAYNAIYYLGKRDWPHDVINGVESASTSKYIGSILGVGPAGLIKYVKTKHSNITTYGSLDFSMVRDIFGNTTTYLKVADVDKQIKASKVAIVLYGHSKGMHYVAIRWNSSSKKYIVHNEYSMDKKPNEYSNLDSLRAGVSNFIVTVSCFR